MDMIAGIPLPNKYGDSPEDSVFANDLEKATTITVEDLITLIKENVAKETWELGEKKFSIDKAASDQILVVHTPEVQQEIEDFLNDLPRYHCAVKPKLMPCVFVASGSAYHMPKFLPHVRLSVGAWPFAAVLRNASPT